MKGETSRERRIQWILDNSGGRFPQRLVTECYHEFGLHWFTDEQIEDMTIMLIEEWRRMVRSNIRNRNLARKASA